MNDVVVYVTRWCGDCRVALRVLNQHNIEHRLVNIDDDKEAQRRVQEMNRGYKSVPTIVFPSGAVVVEPSAVELTAVLRREGLLKTA